MPIINLGYLEDRPLHFTKLLDGGIEESNRILVRLDRTLIIPQTNNQDSSNFIDLETEQINKKKEKVKRYW